METEGQIIIQYNIMWILCIMYGAWSLHTHTPSHKRDKMKKKKMFMKEFIELHSITLISEKRAKLWIQFTITRTSEYTFQISRYIRSFFFAFFVNCIACIWCAMYTRGTIQKISISMNLCVFGHKKRRKKMQFHEYSWH